MDIYYLIVDDVMGFSNIRCIYFGYLYRSKEDKYSYYIERLGSFNPTDMSEVYINILRYWYWSSKDVQIDRVRIVAFNSYMAEVMAQEKNKIYYDKDLFRYLYEEQSSQIRYDKLCEYKMKWGYVGENFMFCYKKLEEHEYDKCCMQVETRLSDDGERRHDYIYIEYWDSEIDHLVKEIYAMVLIVIYKDKYTKNQCFIEIGNLTLIANQSIMEREIVDQIFKYIESTYDESLTYWFVDSIDDADPHNIYDLILGRYSTKI